MSTKLLVTTGLYPPEIGGPATYTKLLEEQLPAHGYEVSVLPFSVSRHLPKVLRHVHFMLMLFKKAHKADVLYAQDTVSVGLPTLLVAKLLRVPFIIRVPGDYAWEQSVQRHGVTDTIDEFQMRKQRLRTRLLQRVQSMVVRCASLVICPSDYFRDLVGRWGVASDRIITIYNGVDLDIDPIVPGHVSPKTIVTAGRLVEWKGIGGLIQMLRRMPEWNLVIIGDGPDRHALEAQVLECDLLDRVIFVGRLTRAEVFGWCVAADAFVLNTYFESFSYQVVEAMHSGTPVIVTDVGSLPELIEPDVHGVLVTPGDLESIEKHVVSTILQPELWKPRTAAAQSRVQVFTIEVCMNRLDKAIQSVI